MALALAFASAPALRADIVLGQSGLLNGSPVTAYVERDASLRVTAVGFLISGAAIRNPGTSDANLYLNLPAQAGVTPFTHLEFGWDTDGHPPPGIYNKPHFDFHYYTISQAARQAIPGSPTTPDPGPQFRPSGFAPPAATVPAMGGHAYDITGPEFNGGDFTKTLMFGFFDRQLVFEEAAATPNYLATLAARTNPLDEAPIRQPGLYALPGLPALVPTSYRFAYDPATDLYSVSVRQLIPTDVPEPGTLALWGLGVLAAAVVRRTRRRGC